MLAPLRGPKPFCAQQCSRGSLQVCNAVSRKKKAEIVTNLKEKLNESLIVFGLRHKGLSVATVQKFRKSMPEGTSIFVCKNNLMKVAVQETEGWSALAEKGCTGDNAWVFVKEDGISDSIKSYFKFEEDLFIEAKKVAPKNTEVKRPTEVSVAVMDKRYLTPADLKKCEALPTKKELYATIAGLAKQPATKLATGIKMIPNKLAIAIKKVSELDEDQTKTVASFAKV
ncbi:hypothetical protein CEUSTIGMA_g6678.t1 [Chlamydomonas eustigma]|uniref:Uncharacterized protein n=1 Tax=Chlamydomonas eustigma TaxID=1157962 RepID=A0A250X827_9CHLO|nr:hypothetical protein CEUSTIGMA_g6678.t1 [Chlamydomonas eustigma]|eukprot:GAX79238.1 hypothetical protein CEUSTIGMA_g6678.t1 [Chlamydomonas eustigma]